MFSKFFGKSRGQSAVVETSHVDPSASQDDPQVAVLMAAIERQRQADPLIGAKLAAKEVLSRVISAMKDDKGIHFDSLFCALGALAGYACQANLRQQAIDRGVNPNAAFQVASTADGKSYYFGDSLNSALAEGQLSVWSLAAGAAQHHGVKNFPDIAEIFQRTVSNIGSPQFGVPGPIQGYAPRDFPINYLLVFWPALLPLVQKVSGDPVFWPVTFSFAIQQAMDMAKGTIPLEIALAITMEAAIPMSKIELSDC